MVACALCPRWFHQGCTGGPQGAAAPPPASDTFQCGLCRCVRCCGPCASGPRAEEGGAPALSAASAQDGQRQQPQGGSEEADSWGAGVSLGLVRSITGLKVGGEQPVPHAAPALVSLSTALALAWPPAGGQGPRCAAPPTTRTQAKGLWAQPQARAPLALVTRCQEKAATCSSAQVRTSAAPEPHLSVRA